MSSKQPVIRATAWWMLIPQILVMLGLVVLVALIVRPQPPVLAVTIGAGIYLLYSYGIRWLLLKPHKRGLRLGFQGDYHAAIASHQASYRFFERHQWVDRYRAITLMSPSAFTYTEMALMNMAYCYGQLGDIPAAKRCYEQTLDRFPDNEVAAAALNLIHAIEQNQATTAPPTAHSA